MPGYNPALYDQAPGVGMPPKSYKGPGGTPSYAESQSEPAARPLVTSARAECRGTNENVMVGRDYKEEAL